MPKTDVKEKAPKLSKEEKAIAEANRLAGLLAAAPASAEGPLSPPAFINDPRLAPALAVWRELAPVLDGTGRLDKLDRSTFAALCYWQAEWITAVDDILARGFYSVGKAVAGGARPWTNPSVARRDTAWAQIMTLSARFGLTPLDRIALNKNRSLINDEDQDLFGARTPQTPASVEKGEGEEQKPDRWASLLPN